MKEIVGKLTKSRDMVVDTYAGTFSALEDSMLLFRHRRSVASNVDSTHVT